MVEDHVDIPYCLERACWWDVNHSSLLLNWSRLWWLRSACGHLGPIRYSCMRVSRRNDQPRSHVCVFLLFSMCAYMAEWFFSSKWGIPQAKRLATVIGSFVTWGFASAFPLYKLWFLLDGQNLPIPLRELTYPFDFSGGGGREGGNHTSICVSNQRPYIFVVCSCRQEKIS